MARINGSFRFDSDTHTYRVGEVAIPAVGTIVKWAREIAGDTSVGPWMKEAHRERGKAVHAATLALDTQADDYERILSRLKPEWRPYFSAYADFSISIRLRWQMLEQPLVHRRLMFAGTPDRVGSLNGYPSLLEIKTGSYSDWHALQTAGQDILLGKSTHRRRYVVYLLKTGQFRLREHTDSGDYLKFLDALASFHLEA